jgi:hypothetical protein
MNWFVDASQPPKAKKAPQLGTGSRTKHPRTLTEKQCASCNEVKPADQYQVTRYKTLASWCNDCKNAAARLSWKKRKERERNRLAMMGSST